MIADKNTLVSAANTLSSSLSTLKSAIDSTKTGCASDCTPITVCNGFDTSSMTMNADFSAVKYSSLILKTIIFFRKGKINRPSINEFLNTQNRMMSVLTKSKFMTSIVLIIAPRFDFNSDSHKECCSTKSYKGGFRSKLREKRDRDKERQRERESCQKNKPHSSSEKMIYL